MQKDTVAETAASWDKKTKNVEMRSKASKSCTHDHDSTNKRHNYMIKDGKNGDRLVTDTYGWFKYNCDVFAV